MTANTSPSTSTSHATTSSHATAHTDSAATRPTLTVRGLGGWRIDIDTTAPACAAVAALLDALDRTEEKTQPQAAPLPPSRA